MINQENLIKQINDSFKYSFDESAPFILKQKRYNLYALEGFSEAINRKKNDSEKIKVLPWFKDFWLYVEVLFTGKTAISISVFQGISEDTEKHQLFRAEWDDYDREVENHPQPHWHITTDASISEIYKKLTDEQEDTYELFEMAKSEIVDIKRIHFAMNGNWQNNETHVHKIDDELKIVNWFQGVLKHVKTELEK